MIFKRYLNFTRVKLILFFIKNKTNFLIVVSQVFHVIKIVFKINFFLNFLFFKLNFSFMIMLKVTDEMNQKSLKIKN